MMETEIIRIPSRRIPWRRIVPSLTAGGIALGAGAFGGGKAIGSLDNIIQESKTYVQQAETEKKLLSENLDISKTVSDLLEEKKHLENILDEQIEQFKDMQDKITELSNEKAELLSIAEKVPELETNIQTLQMWNEHLRYCIEQKTSDICWEAYKN